MEVDTPLQVHTTYRVESKSSETCYKRKSDTVMHTQQERTSTLGVDVNINTTVICHFLTASSIALMISCFNNPDTQWAQFLGHFRGLCLCL